ncbi:hypothetical protein [Desulfobulbus elongatus]|uniref:hypothetical protein n=1 Tax=Desulfobulbus elongatus TaxID=53332 RepID=UPI00048916AB|nr:hypothetical protein [Desulfobulbus elongatus]
MHPLINTTEQPLSQREAKLLAELEAVIDTNMRGFVPVGLALKEIRDQRLYRINYPIFEDYLLREWDMTKKHGYRLIEAADVHTNLKALLEEKVSHGTLSSSHENVNHGAQIIEDLLPQNERQARPLTKYTPEKQRQIWLQVLDKACATGARITANFVISVILEIEQRKIDDEVKKHADRTKKETDLPPLVQTTYQALLQVVVAQNDEGWQAVGKRTMIGLLEDLLETLKK